MGDRLRFTILGCGSSPGVPRITGDWGACDPTNPKNRRLRCSLLVERVGPNGSTVLVVDTSPDFREQMLAAAAERIDGVVYTHPHADHIHGIDDVRGFALSQRARIQVYADQATSDRLVEGFGYCFETPDGSMYPPIMSLNKIAVAEPFSIDGAGGPIHLLPIDQIHGPIHSLAFRFSTDGVFVHGGLCYSPDVSDLPNHSLEAMRKLDVWVVDALQYRPHVSHFSLAETLEWVEALEPKRAVLTHMHIPLDYETVKKETPTHVEPAFDQMVIEV